MKNTEPTAWAPIPMHTVGPIQILGPVVNEEVPLPLATFESPLWPSVHRGARVANRAGGLRAVVLDECMTRSILVYAPSAEEALRIRNELATREDDLRRVTESTSRFARFRELRTEIVADRLFLRLSMTTGDASGHNMVTAAADQLMGWLLQTFPELRHGSVSGNYCTDKKVSAVNGILGRGRSVVAEALIPHTLCKRFLKTTPEQIVQINIDKNLTGSILAGSLRSANAHFANMLLAFYLATGQDAANIIEGSQGFVTAEVREGDLYFAVTLPNLIVGTVGNGKGLDFVQENLAKLGCLEEREPGANARRLAVIAAATAWCGELSLLAALTNPGELMQAHLQIERSK